MVEILTDRQTEIYNYVKNHIETNNGLSPTYREVATNFGITVRAANDHIKAVSRKGYMSFIENKARTLRIVK